MIDQIESEIYNVRYNNKNSSTGNFDVTAIKENNKWKIQISNIKYDGYVENWQVKYKIDENSYWETSYNLDFYAKEEGIYIINVVHGDEIDLGTKSIRIINDGLLSDKVNNETIKIGDYINYIPNEAEQTDSNYTELINELGTYSGSEENTTDTLKQENNLSWRVLDIVKDEDENEYVRLISEKPTTSTITLYGPNGYNNAVYLLDKICNTLYSKTGYTENTKNLKIEDIQKYMKITDYSTIDLNYGNTFKPNYKYYPSIFAQEEGQIITTSDGTIQPETRLGLSEQNEPINQTTQNQATSWTVKYTNWKKSMAENDFTDSIYYNLFINNGNNYNTYWMSSRSAGMGTGSIGFGVRCVISGDVSREALENSNIDPRGYAHAFRPVITLKYNVKLNVKDITQDGLTPETAWDLK